MKTGQEAEYVAHELIETLELGELLEMVASPDCRNRECLEAYFERCLQELRVGNAKEALPAILELPEYVARCRGILGTAGPNHVIHGAAVVGQGLTRCGYYELAKAAFVRGRRMAGADPGEIAALKSAEAYLEALREGYAIAGRLADEAVNTFRADAGRERDDRCLAYALTYRGIVRGYGFEHGADFEPDLAATDFREALRHTAYQNIRASAISGLCASTVGLWFANRPTVGVTPEAVIREIHDLRARLRRDGVPYDSSIDGKARCILGIAMFKLLGGFGEGSERYVVEGRNVLLKTGSPLEIVEVTLYLQWCLLEERRWARVNQEWSVIAEQLDKLPTEWQILLSRWGEMLQRQNLAESLTREVYLRVGHIRGVLIPGQSDGPVAEPVGW